MSAHVVRWAPAALLALGALLLQGVDRQRAMPLRSELAHAVPAAAGPFEGREGRLSPEEVSALGASDYALRLYTRRDAGVDALAASAYVAYYDQQAGGRTIHSPKNCLPGSGWEPLLSTTATLTTADGTAVRVNRYLLQRGEQRAVVLYWYQGRGRVESNEYRVKWDLLRDSLLRRRSDEALARVLVPIGESEAAAYRLAEQTARELMSGLERTLPL